MKNIDRHKAKVGKERKSIAEALKWAAEAQGRCKTVQDKANVLDVLVARYFEIKAGD